MKSLQYLIGNSEKRLKVHMNTRLQDTLEMITGHSVQIPTDNDLTPVDG